MNLPQYEEEGRNSFDRLIQQTQSNNPDEKFQPKKLYNDIWAIIVFILHLLIYIGLSMYLLLMNQFKYDLNNDTIFNLISLKVLGIGFSVAIISSGIYLVLIRYLPTLLIHLSFLVSISMMIALAILSSQRNRIIGIVVCSLSAIIILLFWIFSRDKIQFTSQVLKLVTKFIYRFSNTITISIMFLIIYSTYLIFWIINVINTFNKFSKCEDNNLNCFVHSAPIIAWVFLIYSIFSLFWTAQLIKDVLHIIIAGTFASDYYSSLNGQMNSPILFSLKRALTTSFGSACFGSLILTIIQISHFLVNLLQTSDDGVLAFVGCCLSCIIGCIEDFINFINSYSYTYCAIYGTSFIQGGKRTFDMLQNRGVLAVVNDSLVHSVMFLGAIIIGLISVLCTYGYIHFFNNKIIDNTSVFICLLILSFVLAVIVFQFFSQVIVATTCAFFVCLADAPQLLISYDNKVYDKFKLLYPEVFYLD